MESELEGETSIYAIVDLDKDSCRRQSRDNFASIEDSPSIEVLHLSFTCRFRPQTDNFAACVYGNANVVK